jgi:hypothetical protein
MGMTMMTTMVICGTRVFHTDKKIFRKDID